MQEKKKKPLFSAKFHENLYQVICTAVCFLVAALCIYPLLYTLAVSFAKPEDINYSFLIPIPTKVTRILTYRYSPSVRFWGERSRYPYS